MNRILSTIALLLASYECFSQAPQTITLNAINATNATGYVASNNVNHSGDLEGLKDEGNSGYMSFDLGSLPAGAQIQSATLVFNEAAFPVSIGVNGNPPSGFITGIGKNSVQSQVLYSDIQQGIIYADNVAWDGTPGAKTVTFIQAGLTAIQQKVGAVIGIGLKPPPGTIAEFAHIGGYNSTDATADTPTLKITYVQGTVQKPSTDFYASKRKIRVNDSIAFFDNSGFSPNAWSWDLGDGGVSTEQNPVHTYTTTGTFSIKLTASNSAGSKDTTKTNYITVRPPNVAPVAGHDTAYTDTIKEVEIPFLGNDIDSDGVLLTSTLEIDTITLHGIYTLDLANGLMKYTPNSGFVGIDTLRYRIKDDDSVYTNDAFIFINVGMDDSTTIGIEKVSNILSQVSVFPNPTHSEFNIYCNGVSHLDVRVLNILGQEMLNYSDMDMSQKINIQSLPVGMYILKLRSGMYETNRIISKY